MLGLFAVFILQLRIGRSAFSGANDAIVKLLDYSSEGAAFLFRSQVSGKVEPANVNFAFGVLPSIVFFSSVMAVLYHLGIMQIVIRGISWAMQRSMRTSGAETLSTAANIFVGQTEAPLLVRPFVGAMTKSELLVIMAGGMANTAGGVLAAYVGMLYTFFPDIAGHLLAESIMSAPAALVTSKMIWPEDGVPTTRGSAHLDIPKVDSNVVEAAARGAVEGLSLAFNVAAMLIAFIALVAMMDGGLHWISGHLGSWVSAVAGGGPVGGITFQTIAGWIFVPFAWLMGTPTADCLYVGQLLGQKIVLNEFVAYGTLTQTLQQHHGLLSERAVLIASYALSGFANFGSIAIQIGGIGAMAPERRGDIAGLGILAMLSGSFATFMTACFAASLV
jgi:CNT family concentrative nucleoside transporter